MQKQQANQQKDKMVRFRTEDWNDHDESRKKYKQELGVSQMSIADYLNIAAKFFEENRNKAGSK